MRTLSPVTTLLCVLFFSLRPALPGLEMKKIYANKVEILLPKGFALMSDAIKRSKYPAANRPDLVYADSDGNVNVAFNHTQNKATQAQMGAMTESLSASLKKAYPTAKFSGTGVSTINGRKVGYCELVTPAIDQEIYNLIFFTDLDGRLLLCTFNCTVSKRGEWQPVAKRIFNSLTIKG
ncbi:MAG: hypothetical protein H7Z72_01165 [Bacteroidetes bacterium]|nr:hypothetical protein [Fibrella sp.]